MTEAAEGLDEFEPDPDVLACLDELIRAATVHDAGRQAELFSSLDDWITGDDGATDPGGLMDAALSIHAGLQTWCRDADQPPAEARTVLAAVVGWLDGHREEFIASQLLLLTAFVDQEDGDLDAAERHLLESDRRLSGHPVIERSMVIYGLGDLRARQGRWAEAEEQFTALAEVTSGTEYVDVHAESLLRLGQIAATRGNHRAAFRFFGRAESAFTNLGEAETATQCAEAGADEATTAGTEAFDRGENDETVGLWRSARDVYLRLGRATAAAALARNLGTAESARKNDAAAISWFRTAEHELGADPANALVGSLYFAWGNHAVSRGDVVTADRLLRSARASLLAEGHTEAAAACLTLLAGLSFARGDRDESVRLADLAAGESSDPEMALVREAQVAVALMEAADYAGAVTAFRTLRTRCLELNLPARAFAAALAVLHALVAGGQLAEAERMMPQVQETLAQVSLDAMHGSLISSGPGALAMLRAMMAMKRGNPAQASAELLTAHQLLLAQGSVMLAARVAVSVAEECAQAGEHLKAVWFAVPAVIALDQLQHTLPSSRERLAWQRTIAHAVGVAFTAAAATADRMLIADLLEVIRGHGIPEPVESQSGSMQSLSSLLAEATSGNFVTEQATLLKASEQVQMPWNLPALNRFHATAADYGAATGDRLVRLVVTR